MIYDVLIIGAGPAGMTASIYAKRANLNVAMFEKYVPGGQIVNTAEIENYPGFKKGPGYALATAMLEHTESLEIPLIFDEVTNIVDEGSIKKVITPIQTYETKTVLVATGTVPRRLGVLNEDRFASNGISWCAICDGPIYKDQRVVVIGGGNSAVEEAIYLATLATHVTVIQNLPNLTADKKAQDILRKAENVDYRFSAKVLEFVEEDGKLKGVLIENNQGKEELIETDGVFEYIGLIPTTEMVKDLNITNQFGYLEVNEKMETKVPGVFAAGDVIVKQIRQVVTATSDGAVAAQNILKYLETWK
ncbi:MAG: FAD-dependent oxidoreductase [Acholeplasmataceae bacterium]